jgi:hypothetical protein
MIATRVGKQYKASIEDDDAAPKIGRKSNVCDSDCRNGVSSKIREKRRGQKGLLDLKEEFRVSNDCFTTFHASSRLDSRLVSQWHATLFLRSEL